MFVSQPHDIFRSQVGENSFYCQTTVNWYVDLDTSTASYHTMLSKSKYMYIIKRSLQLQTEAYDSFIAQELVSALLALLDVL